MRTFNYSALKDRKWDNEIIGYVAGIHEHKAKQELFLKQKPDELDKLIEIAKIQSTESSNKIEGIITTSTRIKQLFNDKTTPTDSYQLLSTTASDYPIYAIFSDGVIEIFTEGDEIVLTSDCYEMFQGFCDIKTLDLSNIDTSNVTNMSGMFRDCTSLTSIDLYSFDTSNVESMSGMFACCESLESVCFQNLNTPKLLSISYMLKNCKSLVSLDLSGFDTSSVWGMNNMFCGCESLESLDLSRFNTDNVFYVCLL